jgi:hypothetical protein
MDKTAARTLGLLKLALNNTGNDPALSETRSHIRQAITKLETASQRKERNKAENNYQQWWGNIVAGTAAAAHSPQATMRSLKDLETMINAEQKALLELEKNIRDKAKPPSLLQD